MRKLISMNLEKWLFLCEKYCYGNDIKTEKVTFILLYIFKNDNPF